MRLCYSIVERNKKFINKLRAKMRVGVCAVCVTCLCLLPVSISSFLDDTWFRGNFYAKSTTHSFSSDVRPMIKITFFFSFELMPTQSRPIRSSISIRDAMQINFYPLKPKYQFESNRLFSAPHTLRRREVVFVTQFSFRWSNQTMANQIWYYL